MISQTRHTSSTAPSGEDRLILVFTGGSLRCTALIRNVASFKGTDGSCNTSYLVEADARVVMMLGVSLGSNCDGGCNAVTLALGCTSETEIFSASQAVSGWGVGSGRSEFLTSVNILSRRPFIDPSNINSMAAVRCGFPPDEQLRMMSESKEQSTEGFRLDWKSSYSISLICLWLYRGHINTIGHQRL